MPPWARLVRTRWIDDALDVIQRPDGIRLARPLRTLFRLAAVSSQHRFERAAEDVWHLGLATPAEVGEYLTAIRRQGLTGVTKFATWLEQTMPRSAASQSGLELDFVALIRRLGLPDPERQYPLTLPSGEVVHLDLAWPDIRLAVEPGHSWWHGGELRARADEARDRACHAVGWQVERYSQDDQHDPATGPELVAMYRRRADLCHLGRVSRD